ncbi:LamG-like jellyroll fold domain-containing protein, partial [[Eubacterium] cellulosolvens]
MKARTFYNRVMVFAILIVLIFSSLMVNYAEDNSKLELDLTEEPGEAGKTARQTMDTNKTFMNFSADGCNGTYIDDKNVTLAWHPPQTALEKDDDTTLLCHFDDTLKGQDGEMPVEYMKNQEGLIGWWKLDEGGGKYAYDSSGNGNFGTLKPDNNATWTVNYTDNAQFGKALEFDGVDDTVQFSSLDTSDDNTWTWEFWLYDKSTTAGTRRWLITTLVGFTPTTICIREQGGEIALYTGTVNPITGGHTWKNKWNYYTLVCDGSNIILYENGASLLSTSSFTSDPESGFYIGGTDSGEYFNGIIDEVAIYDRAKPANEVKADYNRGLLNHENSSFGTTFENGYFNKGIGVGINDTLVYSIGPSLDQGTIGVWRFDDGLGTSTTDESGNNNHGTLKDWLPGNTDGNTPPQWIDGKFGKALDFDGTDDYVEMFPFDFDFTDITIEIWLKTSDTSNSGTILSASKLGQSDNELILFDYRSLSVTVDGAGAATGVAFNDGNWHHIIATWQASNGSVKLYKDGNEVFSHFNKKGAIIQLGNLIFGQEQDNFRNDFDTRQAADGILDEAYIFNMIKPPEKAKSDYYSYDNINMAQGTLEMSVKPDWNGNDGENHTLFFCGESWNNDSVFILKDSDNYLKFITADNQSNYLGFPKVKVNDWRKDNWYNLAFTWDPAGKKEIYIDGLLMATAAGNYMPSTFRPQSKLFIGSSPDGFGSFNGVIDELRISKRVRTGDELRNYHQMGIYESEILDTGEPVAWENIEWNTEVPLNTELYLQTRTSDDNITWTQWSGNKPPSDLELGVYFDSSGETINASPARYIQWRAVLKSTDGIYTPILNNVTITWNHLPKALNVTIAPAKPTIHDVLVIDYDYLDLDGDMEATTTFEWMVDRGTGVFVNSGIHTQNLAPKWTAFNERWFCTITPYDGKNYGFLVESPVVRIAKGNITEILITPAYVEVSADDTVQFTAKALDADNNEITTAFLWNITSGGTIDQTGLFTPETTGLHFVYASAEGVF